MRVKPSMTTPPLLSGFDGLMTLSRREGVDVRPTLLRVLTDLYVQSDTHTDEERRQYVELASRLIEQVDDATRAAVRARLAIYPHTPVEIAVKLGLVAGDAGPPPLARSLDPAAETHAAKPSPNVSMLPDDAAKISDMFFAADTRGRAEIIDSLAEAPLRPSPAVPAERVKRAIQILEMAAFSADTENFIRELSDALILPERMAAQVVNDPGGEPLACALKALDMAADTYQRILLFLDPAIGSSVTMVYRLSRLYDRLSQRAALVLLAAWRSTALHGMRGKHRPLLHDDERHRARAGGSKPQTDSQRSVASPVAPFKAGGTSE